MCAMRHMYEFGTTSEQLAWIKVAASHHAQYNPHAMLRKVVTVEDVVNSPMISDPLHRLDCCVVSDGGGALIVDHAGDRAKPEAPAGQGDRRRRGDQGPECRRQVDLTYSGARWSGPRGLRGGRRDAGRHQVRLDLRQLHHHGADAARGSRLLREGPGRQVRRGRQPDLAASASCPSTPMAAGCATTIRPTAAASPR